MDIVNKENKLITSKNKEAIYNLKNPNHINKIFFMLFGIGLLNLNE